ncbi:MAG: hypothetical protein N3B16_08550 [Candidatus Aminicenantes bacterium]|nr:hypothetical protein [Candidatus Aminicenantes bacterium]
MESLPGFQKSILRLFTSLVATICLLLLICPGRNIELNQIEEEVPIWKVSRVLPINDDLLWLYEKSDREFIKIEIWDKIIYYYQRKIGDAIVEKDYLVYQFDAETKQLQLKIEHWRPDLPEAITPAIKREQAEAMAEGIALFSTLYPQSDVFPFRPAPKNPCWVVRSFYDQNLVVTVIDAMTGERKGFGIPPPYNGFAFSGPGYQLPCRDLYYDWAWNTAEWFIRLGYSTPIPESKEKLTWPAKSEIESQVKDPQNLAFYEIAHGGSSQFAGSCAFNLFEWTYASEIRDWMTSSPPKRLVFLASCGAMTYPGPDSLSYEFRKGQSVNTSVVGYFHMDSKECESCWSSSIVWQNYFFTFLSTGKNPYEAFLLAHINLPPCLPCIKYVGDRTINDKFLFPPLNFQGKKVQTRSLLQLEFINLLTWEPNPKNRIKINAYRIYAIENDNWTLIAQVDGETYRYWQRKVEKTKRYKYVIVSVFDNRESDPAYCEIN